MPDFWSAKKAGKKGGLATMKKYGNPGTFKGRINGGLVSQQKRKLHPELYQHCNLRKNILKPRNTTKLAEFFGIVLGDGGISYRQVVITLNKENDKGYISFVCGLIKELFGITPAVYHFRSLKSKKIAGITISSTSLVEFLLSKGLKIGNKVKQQVGVPDWIKNKVGLSKSCLRGLIDTDGGVYFHRHKSHGCQCFNIGLQLTNKSIPILTFAEEALKAIGFTPKFNNKRHVNLYREAEVYRYAKEVGFSNLYHFERVQKFSKIKYGRGAPNGKAHAWKACAP